MFRIKISHFFIVKCIILLYMSNISLKTRQMGLKVMIELTKEQEAKIAKEHLSNKENTVAFSIAKASRIIGISQSTIHRRIKDGFITVIQMGKSPRITQEEINRYMNS